MLTRTNLLVLAALATVAAGSTACVLTTTTDGVGGTGGSATVSTTSTTSATTSTTSTTTSTTSTTSSSSTGGGCIGATGTGKVQTDCNVANLPAKCPDQSQPLAIATCNKGFSIYQSGLWEELLACIGNIPATTDDACTDPTATNNVTACLSTMYNDACVNTQASAQCDAFNNSCITNSNDHGFDVAACKHDLNPFSADGLTAYTNCFDAHPTDPCSGLHTTCFDQVTTF